MDMRCISLTLSFAVDEKSCYLSTINDDIYFGLTQFVNRLMSLTVQVGCLCWTTGNNSELDKNVQDLAELAFL